MISLRKTITALLAAILVSKGLATETSATVCTELVDNFVADHVDSKETTDNQINAFQSLIENCPETPQTLHNLAVLKARQQHWDEAITLLQKSLAMDERAQHTASMLQSIHRFRAVQAYRQALQSNNPPPPPPLLELQNSSFANFQRKEERKSDTSSTSEEQLQSLLNRWWQFYSGQNGSCDNCFLQTDAQSTAGRVSTNTLLKQEMPDPSILEVGEQRVAIFRYASNQIVTLQLKSGPAGWIIDHQQVLP